LYAFELSSLEEEERQKERSSEMLERERGREKGASGSKREIIAPRGKTFPRLSPPPS